jgi:hypothetical protein
MSEAAGWVALGVVCGVLLTLAVQRLLRRDRPPRARAPPSRPGKWLPPARARPNPGDRPRPTTRRSSGSVRTYGSRPCTTSR